MCDERRERLAMDVSPEAGDLQAVSHYFPPPSRATGSRWRRSVISPDRSFRQFNPCCFCPPEAQAVTPDEQLDGVAKRSHTNHFDVDAGGQSHFHQPSGERILAANVRYLATLADLHVRDRFHAT